jgi:peptide-methionine (S)-S-oxide reductase
MSQETAILAGGCFWGMQDLIRRYDGVLSTRVGYSGGDVPNATYRNHGTHAEAIEIVFDPRDQISYRKLLEFFFQIHDPSTANRQGNDVGPELPLGDLLHQRRAEAVALDTIADVDASGLWPGKVVTEVAAGGRLLLATAEPEHQDYLETHPNGYTCHFIRRQEVGLPGLSLHACSRRPTPRRSQPLDDALREVEAERRVAARAGRDVQDVFHRAAPPSTLLKRMEPVSSPSRK